MKILILSKDPITIDQFNNRDIRTSNEVLIYRDLDNPLDIMSSVCSTNPTVLIADDEYLEPNSVHILNSIKKVNPKINIIFITSNTSVDLGREVSQLGIHYYAQKPLLEDELNEAIQSLIKS